MAAETARTGEDKDAVCLDRVTLGEIVDEAKRAPSPHNTQPARWRVHDDVLELLEDPARRLLASDPSGRDHRLALGAAWEGTRLALGKRGLKLRDEIGAFVPDAGVVVRGHVVVGGVRDPLVDAVFLRTTWRDRFVPADADVIKKLERSLAREGASVSTNKAIIDEAARAIDDATVKALLSPRYLEELVAWTRFKRDHPSYLRDGMNLEALCISAPAGALAKLLLQRRTFDTLAKVGAAGWLVSEASPTRSASALVALTASPEEPDLVIGARLYRAWLTIALAKLALCPMSVLTDDVDLNARFARALGVPEDRKLIHVWRVGRVDHDVDLAVRLPTVELVL